MTHSPYLLRFKNFWPCGRAPHDRPWPLLPTLMRRAGATLCGIAAATCDLFTRGCVDRPCRRGLVREVPVKARAVGGFGRSSATCALRTLGALVPPTVDDVLHACTRTRPAPRCLRLRAFPCPAGRGHRHAHGRRRCAGAD